MEYCKSDSNFQKPKRYAHLEIHAHLEFHAHSQIFNYLIIKSKHPPPPQLEQQ